MSFDLSSSLSGSSLESPAGPPSQAASPRAAIWPTPANGAAVTTLPPQHKRANSIVDGPNTSAYEGEAGLPSPSSRSARRSTGVGVVSPLLTNRGSLNASDHIIDESYDVASALGFQKTLSSDVSSDRAMELLREAHAFEPIFSDLFEAADLPACNSILSVLTFAPGERIITAGEDASFAALILSGEVIVQTSPTDFWPLPTSSWIGEMAYYERGPRSADVTAKTAAVLAVLSYEDMERLALEGQGELQHKFTMLWSMHTIVKLRKMIQSAQDKASALAAAAAGCKCDKNSVPAPIASPASPVASVVKKSKDKSAGGVVKKETLFVERLKKQSETLAAQEAKQKTELAQMQKLVKKANTEAQYAHESVRAKITKLETENKDLLARVNDLSKKIVIEKKKSKEAETISSKALLERQDAIAALPDLERRIRDLKKDMKTVQEERTKSEEDALAQMRKKEDEMTAFATQVATLQSMIDQLHVDHKAELSTFDPLIVERDKLRIDVTTLQDKLTHLDNEKGFADFRVRSLQEQKEQYELDAAGWRRKAQDIIEAHEKLKNKYRHDLHEVLSEKKQVAWSHKTYHKLIRMLSLKTYVRNFLLRRHLFNIHLRISEMVVKRWEEKMEYVKIRRRDGGGGGGGGGDEKESQHTTTSLYQQLTNATNKNKRLAQQFAYASALGTNHVNNATNPPSSASSASASASLAPSSSSHPVAPLLTPYHLLSSTTSDTFDPNNPAAEMSVYSYTNASEVQHVPKEQLRLEKKKYLHALRSKKNPPTTILQYLQSIEEELMELKTPVDEMNLTIIELRTTLTSFFQRNVQLTSKCINTKKALEVATANYNALKESVRARHLAEQTSNPFSQNLLLESSKQAPTARKSSAAAASPTSAAGGWSTLLGQDEKEDGIGPNSAASFSAPNTARPSSSHGVHLKKASTASSTSGAIDWAALDHEKSSGYGVTRPPVRRNAATPTAGATVGHVHARRPSTALQPRPPTAPNNTQPTNNIAPHQQQLQQGGPFTLPRVQ